MLPGIKTHATCIRFCPLLFKLQEKSDEDPPALIDLPYRMVFAVATIEHVLIYTTQSIYPIAVIKNLHYDSINDLSWMNHRMLVIASSDGYCSFLAMNEESIGEPLMTDSEAIPESYRDHFKEYANVSIHKHIEVAMQNKNQTFQKISFKSKKPAEPLPERQQVQEPVVVP